MEAALSSSGCPASRSGCVLLAGQLSPASSWALCCWALGLPYLEVFSGVPHTCFWSMTHSSDGSMLHCFLHGVIDLVLVSGTGSSGAAGDAEQLRGVERLRSVPRPLVFRELWLQMAACYGKAIISHPQSEADLEGAIWCLQSTAVLDDTEEPGATLTESLQVQVWYFYCTFCAGCGQTRRL